MGLEDFVEAVRGEQTSENTEVRVAENLRKFIIFTIEDKVYALPAGDVQEIMLDLTVYYLPFLPSYLPGMINRLGEPYALVDLHSLFTRRHLVGRAFLILKAHISKVAFVISSVQDIVSVPASQVRRLSASLGPMDLWVDGLLDLKGKEVFLLSVEALVSAVKEAFHE